MGNGAEMPIGVDFGSPDVHGYFRGAPDVVSSDILENRATRKSLFLRENGFLGNDILIALKRQTAKTEMTARTRRRYHVFIEISHYDGFCQSNSCFP